MNTIEWRFHPLSITLDIFIFPTFPHTQICHHKFIIMHSIINVATML